MLQVRHGTCAAQYRYYHNHLPHISEKMKAENKVIIGWLLCMSEGLYELNSMHAH